MHLVLPEAYRTLALSGCQNKVQHLGVDRMLNLLGDR